MKKVKMCLAVALFTVLLLGACQSGPDKYEKVDMEDIDLARLETAMQISHRLLAGMRDNGFYQLSEDEANSKMLMALNRPFQELAYTEYRSSFGDYRGLKFDQMLKPTDGTLYEVYRFRGEFDPNADVEIRAILDARGKLSGFFVKVWKDELE